MVEILITISLIILYIFVIPFTPESYMNITSSANSSATGGTVTKKVKSPVTKKVKSPVTGEVKSPVNEEVKSPVTEEVKSPVTEEVKSPVTEGVKSPVTKEVNSPVTEEVNSPDTEGVKSPVIEGVKSPVIEGVKSSVNEEVKSLVTEEVKSPVTLIEDQAGRVPKDKNSISALEYPYKKYYIKLEDILSRFNRLKEYKPVLVRGRAEVFSLPRGTPDRILKFDNTYIYMKVTNEDYDLYDNISDYFQEQVRVQCKRVDQKISSYEYWQTNKNNIINNVIDKGEELSIYNVREALYSAWYECTSFRPSLFVGFYKLFGKERPIKKVLDMSMGCPSSLRGRFAVVRRASRSL